METSYITTDLDLESNTDLQIVADQLTGRQIVHYCGQVKKHYQLTLGLLISDSSEDEAISAFCDFAERLPKDARTVWDNCTKITFNMGYEAGNVPSTWRSSVSPEVLERVVKLGGQIAITIYKHD